MTWSRIPACAPRSPAPVSKASLSSRLSHVSGQSLFAQNSCDCCHLQSLQLESPFLKPTSCAPFISINYSSVMLVIRCATLTSPARALQWGKHGLDFQMCDDFPGNDAMGVGKSAPRGWRDDLCWNKPHITRFQGLQMLLKGCTAVGVQDCLQELSVQLKEKLQNARHRSNQAPNALI